MVRVRGFRWSDLDGVLAAHNSAAGAGAATRAGLEAELRRGPGRAERSVWVVAEGERIEGYGRLRPWHSPGWLQVEVVVRPERRRQVSMCTRNGASDVHPSWSTDRIGAASFLAGESIDDTSQMH